MPSQQILDFITTCPPMPPRMPVEALPAAREGTIAVCMQKFPLRPEVELEPVNWSGVEAVWFRPPNATEGKAIMYVHGGGFMWSSAMGHGGIISNVASSACINTLALDYKLAPESQFPSQLNEGVSLYRSLLDNGYDSADIAFVGDSAGGGLIMSILIACKNEGLPLPSCAAITSAWADMSISGETIEWVTCDPNVSREGLQTCVDHYVPEGHDLEDHYYRLCSETMKIFLLCWCRWVLANAYSVTQRG